MCMAEQSILRSFVENETYRREQMESEVKRAIQDYQDAPLGSIERRFAAGRMSGLSMAAMIQGFTSLSRLIDAAIAGS